ncbi:MAG: hypothetical protein KIT16_16665 [Rhodospirillaceae bacterium]|nr:hypothetical protein [Rhodospirillaceae bacterium]
MWDGVSWNASPDQVIAAAQGRAKPGEGWGGRRVKPTLRPALALKDLVEGDRLLGGQRVHAVFWFTPDRRLWSVTEEPAAAAVDGPAGSGCAALEAALAARYGPIDLSTTTGIERHLIWRDEGHKTRVHFRDSGEGVCAIEYVELRGPLDR